MVRRARMRIARLVVGIAERTHDLRLELRAHLIRRRRFPDLKAPWIVGERLGAGGRWGNTRPHGTCQYHAASEERGAGGGGRRGGGGAPPPPPPPPQNPPRPGKPGGGPKPLFRHALTNLFFPFG